MIEPSAVYSLLVFETEHILFFSLVLNSALDMSINRYLKRQKSHCPDHLCGNNQGKLTFVMN